MRHRLSLFRVLLLTSALAAPAARAEEGVPAATRLRTGWV